MRRIKLSLLGIVIVNLLTISTVYADKQALKNILVKTMPSLTVDDITESEIKGLYEITVDANIFYASEDGRYLIQGRLFDLIAKKDLTEARLAKVRAALINKVAKKEMIIFKAPNSKYTINIFTDIDCGYCRKLHSELDQYLAEGITIQYLFFPRAGKDSESYKKAVAVWCSDDRNTMLTTALTPAKSGSKVLDFKTCTNPVDAHMALGDALGVRGTPMMVTTKGTVFPGYMPAKRLATALREDNK